MWPLANAVCLKIWFCNFGLFFFFFFYLQSAVQQFCLLHQSSLLLRAYAFAVFAQFPALTQMHQHLCAAALTCGPLSPISAWPSDWQRMDEENNLELLLHHVPSGILDLSIMNVLRWHSPSLFPFTFFSHFPMLPNGVSPLHIL